MLERGDKIPAHLIPPEVAPEYQSWLDAFWELSSERQIGMGFGKVPHSAIRQWSDSAEFDEEEFESFVGAIRAMDLVWLEEIGKRSDKDKGDRGGRQKEPDRIMSQPLTKALFDALF